MSGDNTPAERQIDVAAEIDRLRGVIDALDKVDALKDERDQVVRTLSEAGVSRNDLAELTGLSVHGVDAIKRKKARGPG